MAGSMAAPSGQRSFRGDFLFIIRRLERLSRSGMRISSIHFTFLKIGWRLMRKTICMVPEAGLEPARCCQRGILSPLCLPISPLGHCLINYRHHCQCLYGGAGRNRTGVRGVAVRYMTTLPPRQIGAEKETRTPDPDLGKVVLYQLSYFRKTHCPCTPRQGCTFYVLGANSQLKDQVSESAETMMPLLSAYR